ncbi:hypothetical protein BDV93DRAFT_323023 [Ceratobasidium sp. AG-I]|nr:hypothetical protein BDV93DRAFT_323023 [Ceratobasidium sp. AG-I]
MSRPPVLMYIYIILAMLHTPPTTPLPFSLVSSSTHHPSAPYRVTNLITQGTQPHTATIIPQLPHSFSYSSTRRTTRNSTELTPSFQTTR